MIVDDNADTRYPLAQQLAFDFARRFCAPTGAHHPWSSVRFPETSGDCERRPDGSWDAQTSINLEMTADFKISSI
jgi:hypothetical protein